MNTWSVDESTDCTGLHCPLPMIKARRIIRSMQAGQVLEMTATDPAVVSDVRHWVTQEKHELLQASQHEGGIYHFLIRKRRS